MAWFLIIKDGFRLPYAVQADNEGAAERRMEKWLGIDGWKAIWMPWYEPQLSE